jgi:hypothetical protein
MAIIGKQRRQILLAATLLLVSVSSTIPHAAAKGLPLEGKWQVTITMPASPGSNQKNSQMLIFNVSPMDSSSLNGRLTVTDQSNRTVSGVWREVGKMISITFEPVCDQSQVAPCSTLIMLGRVKGGGTMIKGQVVVEWDRPDSSNPALYETDNGRFSGQALD